MAKAVHIEGWFKQITEKIGGWFESFNFSYDNLIAMASYLGVGCAIGFFLKKFGKLFFFGVLFAGLLFYGLQYFDFMTINMEKLRELLGFSYNTTLHDMANLYWDWIKNHIPLSLSFGAGFLFGYKIG